jgi:sporulation protein YlmC with PRC-barrel domain
MMKWIAALPLLLAVSAAQALTASTLIGRVLADGAGRAAEVRELIVDVHGGRVAYLLVETGGRPETLPVRALGAGLRLDFSLADEAARLREGHHPRFRRATQLLGRVLMHPGGERIGTIVDFSFDQESGRIREVNVATEQGPRELPPSALARGRYPPFTRWLAEDSTREASPSRATQPGFTFRPSDERARLHDHRWD